jgi:hypothetical protein
MVKDLGAAINRAVERSGEVTDAIQNLRSAGYQLELTLRLEIGLRSPNETIQESRRFAPALPGGQTTATLHLTEEDKAILRRMKIRCDD